MTNPKCPACGHVNLLSATACEMCDARLGDAGAGVGAEWGGAAGGAYDARAGEFGAGAGGYAAGASGPGAYGESPRADAPPSEIPAPPFKGVGDVIGPMLEVYRKHFVLVGILVAVTTLPVALLQYAAVQAIMAGADDMIESARVVSFGMSAQVLAGLLSFIGSALLSGALVHAVVGIQRAGAASAGESLRRGVLLLPQVFFVTLLYAIVTGVGYLLLIVPGVIFSLMYAVAVPVAVVEGLGPFSALKRSAQLTDGYKGLIFLTYFLWGLAIAALNLFVIGSFVAAGGAESLPSLALQALVGGMLNSSTTVLTVYVYLGILRERGRGFETRAFTPAAAAR